MIEELYKEFMDSRFNDGPNYHPGTGSHEWWDIKTDYELRSMDVAGAVSYWKVGKLNEVDLPKNQNDLKLFQSRLLSYKPKDDVEKQEKTLISERVEIGLKIFEELIKVNKII